MVRVNFADVEDQREFKPLPPGNYHLMVTDYEEKQAGQSAKNPGAEMIRWEFQVQSGDYANRKVWDQHVFVKDSMWKPKAMLKAAGFEIPDDEFEFEPGDVVGSEVLATLGVRQAEKKPDGGEYPAKNVINAFYPYEAGDGDLLT